MSFRRAFFRPGLYSTGSIRARVLAVARAIAIRLDRLSTGQIAGFTYCFLAVLFAACLVYAATAAMWLDELHGYIVLRLPNVSEMIRALKDGVDNSAPLYLLICRALTPVFGGEAFDLRFPSAIGFCAACISIYIFLKRRLPRIYALLGVLLMALMGMYSIEGRPYGLTLGCTAVAIVAWQSAAADRRRSLSIVLATIFASLAIALHYWSIFLIPALALAELCRWRARRRIDWPLALAIALPAAVMIAHIPFLQAAQRFLPYFWSKPYFPFDSRFLLEGRFGYAPLLILFIVPLTVWWRRPWTVSGPEPGGESTLRMHEWVLVTALAVMPYALIALAAITTRIFQDRYVLWTGFGIAAFAAALLARYFPGRPLAAIVCFALIGVSGIEWKNAFAHRHWLRMAEPSRQVLLAAPQIPGPIVVADHRVYMELAHYETPALQRRLIYLDNADLERFYTQSDTGSLLMSAVRSWTNLRIRNYCGFLGQAEPFLLLSDAEDWLPWHLSASGYRVTPTGLGLHPVLFLVDPPPLPAKTPEWIRAANIRLSCSD